VARRPKPDRGPCRVCGRRKARFANFTCIPCHALVEAEGTHDQFGVPKESETRKRWRRQAAEYNKLIKAGWTQSRIAEKWGISLSSLRGAAYRWKADGGIKVVPGWGSRIVLVDVPKKPTNKVDKKANEHGGGRWGITKCTCDLCRIRRNISRAECNRRYRQARKLKREAARRQMPS